MDEKDIEIKVQSNWKHPRLTLSNTRLAIKMPESYSSEQRQEVINYILKLHILLGEIQYTVRGFLKSFEKLCLYSETKDSKKRKHLQYTIGENFNITKHYEQDNE